MIEGFDWDAPPCNVCGHQPRIHIHKFYEEVVVNGRKKNCIRTKAYYDCPCGECITDWMDSEYDTRGLNKISKHAKEFAREAWDKRKFL